MNPGEEHSSGGGLGLLFHGENTSGTEATQRPADVEADRKSKA